MMKINKEKMTNIMGVLYLIVFVVASLVGGVFNVSLVDYIFLLSFLLSAVWIAIYDWDHHIIPNKSLIVICVLKLLWILFSEHAVKNTIEAVLTSLFFAVAAIAVGMVFHGMRLTMGYGDYKFLIALSFCLGVNGTLLALIVALLVTVPVCAVVKIKNISKELIPAAPFLSFGAAISVLVSMLLEKV